MSGNASFNPASLEIVRSGFSADLMADAPAGGDLTGFAYLVFRINPDGRMTAEGTSLALSILLEDLARMGCWIEIDQVSLCG